MPGTKLTLYTYSPALFLKLKIFNEMVSYLKSNSYMNNPEYLLEGLMLKLKLQYFARLIWRTDSLEKTDAGKDWRREEKGMTEDEMIGWHYQLNGHEFE